MRILYIHRTQARGVEGVHIREIVHGLRKLGHDVVIQSPVGEVLDGTGNANVTNGSGKWKIGILQRASKHLPELAFEFAEMLYNLIAFRAGLGLIGRRKIDAIYERYSIFGLAGALLSQKFGVPLVLEINYTSLSPLVRQRSRILRPLAKSIDKFVFRRTSRFSVVSSYLRQHLIEEFGVAPERIEVVPNAADPDVFAPSASPCSKPGEESSEREVIGFVGGFYPWHGLGLLVDAFIRIAPEFPNARLLLVGDGPLKEPIARRIASSGYRERVDMPGAVDHGKIPEYVASFDIGVMPDSNVYGSPMKIFEYMAMGKPVVVPDYLPLLDVVTDGEEGFVFPRGQVDALSNCLGRLLRDRQMRMGMGAQARRRIVDRHNWLNNAMSIERMMKGERIK